MRARRPLPGLALAVWLAWLGLASPGLAGVTAEVEPREIELGESALLRVVVDDDRPATVALSGLTDFLVTPRGQVVGNRTAEGTSGTVAVYRFELIPKRAGELTLPPLAVTMPILGASSPGPVPAPWWCARRHPARWPRPNGPSGCRQAWARCHARAPRQEKTSFSRNTTMIRSETQAQPLVPTGEDRKRPFPKRPIPHTPGPGDCKRPPFPQPWENPPKAATRRTIPDRNFFIRPQGPARVRTAPRPGRTRSAGWA